MSQNEIDMRKDILQEVEVLCRWNDADLNGSRKPDANWQVELAAKVGDVATALLAADADELERGLVAVAATAVGWLQEREVRKQHPLPHISELIAKHLRPGPLDVRVRCAESGLCAAEGA